MAAPETSSQPPVIDGEMSMAELASQLDLGGVVLASRDCSLIRNQGSLRLTVMSEAWQDADIDYSDPGCVDQYWLPDQEMLVVDFSDD